MDSVDVRRLLALIVGGCTMVGGFAACSDEGTSGTPNDAGAAKDATTPDVAAPDASSNVDAGVDAAVPTLDCEVAIVGAGPGGLHTAFRLTNPPPDAGAVTGITAPSGVCVFEKSDRVGGRVRDVSFGPGTNDVTGTGAYRMYDNQYTYMLANELGVTTAAPVSFSNLRGIENPPAADAGQYFGYSGDAFKGLYGQTANDDDMWADLLCGAHVPKNAGKEPNYAAIDGGIGGKSSAQYAGDVLGAQGARYFFDMNRFRADFTDEVDAVGYLEYSMIDYFASGAIRYPIPGHSAILGKMKAAIETKGGRIYLSEAVRGVASQADGTFALLTSAHAVRAKQVILAVEHGAVQKLTGDVITSITDAKEYKSITSAKSMQVTHQWNRAWWQGNLRYPNAAKVVGGDLPDGSAPILRADTTIMPDGSCINSIEMPYTPHHDALKVTRTVYSDNRACVDKNLQIYGDGGAGGEQALNDQLKKSLRILFPAVFDGTANEPQIVKTDVNTHVEAWYYLKKGATANGVSNKSVFDWSVAPVAGKKVYLVGDSWYPLGSGWMNAAYISSLRVLKTHFGLNVATHELQPAACP